MQHPLATELRHLIQYQRILLNEADRVDVKDSSLAAYLRQCASKAESEIIALREKVEA